MFHQEIGYGLVELRTGVLTPIPDPTNVPADTSLCDAVTLLQPARSVLVHCDSLSTTPELFFVDALTGAVLQSRTLIEHRGVLPSADGRRVVGFDSNGLHETAVEFASDGSMLRTTELAEPFSTWGHAHLLTPNAVVIGRGFGEEGDHADVLDLTTGQVTRVERPGLMGFTTAGQVSVWRNLETGECDVDRSDGPTGPFETFAKVPAADYFYDEPPHCGIGSSQFDLSPVGTHLIREEFNDEIHELVLYTLTDLEEPHGEPTPAGPDPAQPPGVPNESHCRHGDVHVIGARGSGQTGNGGLTLHGDPVGQPIADFLRALNLKLLDRQLALTYEGLLYPAVSSGTTLIDSLLTFDRQHVYEKSVRGGLAVLRVRIATIRRLCPDTTIFLTGYSQGADVVGGFLQSWTENIVEEPWFGGAYLFADPRMNPRDPIVVGTFRGDDYLLSAEGLFGARPRFPDGYSRRVESICMRDDAICAAKPTNTAGAAAVHTRYSSLLFNDRLVPAYAALKADLYIAASRLSRDETRALQQAGGPLDVVLSGPTVVGPGTTFAVSVHATPFGDTRLARVEVDADGDGQPDTITVSPEAEVTAPQTLGPQLVRVTVTAADGRTGTATHEFVIEANGPTTPAVPGRPFVEERFGALTVHAPPTDPDGDVLGHVLVDDEDRILGMIGEEPLRIEAFQPKQLRVRAITAAGLSAPGAAAEGTPGTWPGPANLITTTGQDPFDATQQLTQGMWQNGARVAVLARVDDYADALAASAVAGTHDAPLLYTERDRLPPDTVNVLLSSAVDEVILMGGDAAISERVEAAVSELGIRTSRVAGANRYATAAQAVSMSEHAIIVEGAHADPARGWPDAVSASALSALSGWPILLVEHDRLPDETADTLVASNFSSATIVGGEAAVSSAVSDELTALGLHVDRIAGPTRYGTSAALTGSQMERFDLPAGLMAVTGHDWTDALAAGAAAQRASMGILLIDGDDLARSPESESFLIASGLRVWAHWHDGRLTPGVVDQLGRIAEDGAREG